MKFSTAATTLLAGAIATADAYSCTDPLRTRFTISSRPGFAVRRGQRFLSPFSSFPFDVMLEDNTMPRRRYSSILDKTFEELNREMNQLDNADNKQFNTVYPEYQVNSNDELLSVSIDLPGVDSSNIDVLVEENDLLTIKGFRETKNSKYEFQQKFRFDPSVVVVEKLEANLENGVLTVTAPKEMKKEELKKIPINVIKGDKAELVLPTTTPTLKAETKVEGKDENTKESEETNDGTTVDEEKEEEEETTIDLDVEEKDLGADKTTTI